MELRSVKTPAQNFTGDFLVGTGAGVVVRVRAGDTVISPPGKDHWHGAAADTFMSHLAMLEAEPAGGDPTTWLELLAEHDKSANQR